MCNCSKSELCPDNLVMEGIIQEHKHGFLCENSILLELSAADDLEVFKFAVENKGLNLDGASYWYGRRIGSKKMGLEERTPLMIASIYGSTQVLKYIIGTGKIDINRGCGSDGATALHCAASGGSARSVETVKLLLDAYADVNSVDFNGNKPGDLISPFLKWSSNTKWKTLEMLLKGPKTVEEEILSLSSLSIDETGSPTHQLSKEVPEKKEYPIDVLLPDINDGVYGSDEFRMFSFKVKPCSRAYSHDWTECPFAHPGENAKRRDPRKYMYSCVPCPEFRKGSCGKGDSCEYAHGVFESWLHPAQYRTRLCKDETGCSRKVCFFAHKPEELRPLYASTGSAMPSPKPSSFSGVDMSTLSQLGLGSTPPMSPSARSSSPMAGSMWQNKGKLSPPMLQLSGSRLKTARSARDLELEIEMRQQLINEMSSLSSPSYWNQEYSRNIGDLNPTNLDSVFGSLDPSFQMHQSTSQVRANYPSSNQSSSPVRKPSINGFQTSGSMAAAVMNSRSAGFTKRSQSFIDRGAMAHNSANSMSSNLSNWGSPNGKLDWGYQGEDLNKLKKSASFGYRSGNTTTTTKASMAPLGVDEPDVSWVNSLVKDVSSVGSGLYSSEQNRGGTHERLPPWVEQLYIEHEQMVA